MLLNKNKWSFIPMVFCVMLSACNKYLDKKADRSLVTPSSLKDLQMLLDRVDVISERNSPLPEIAADDYYITTADWQGLSDPELRASYVWDANASFINSWRNPYQAPIYYCNVVLDQLPRISHNDQATANAIKGAALFIRALAYQQLATLYCRPYSNTAATDPGLALRLDPATETPSVRSTVQQTYDQIIQDFKTAADLLPDQAIFPTRPIRAAAYGALARTYLSMRDYTNAAKFADLYLQKMNTLIDYNTLVPVGAIPVPSFNVETAFYSNTFVTAIPIPPRVKMDTTLIASYVANDLRKEVFFGSNGDGTFLFRGAYSGSAWPHQVFTGIATDEQLLIRAECAARAGNKDAAMTDLNTLLEKRWKTGTYVALTATNAADALAKVLVERRKELVFRGLRWSDLRRLNLEGANITLTRIINGTTYTLPPNDLRWVFLIPREVMARTNLEQNPR
jgi:starch-binding outer membrane protein, SusD/RagB family